MNKMRRIGASVSLPLVLSFCAAISPARAQNLIGNGGFESGFSGWNRADQPGSDGSFLVQTGTGSPVNTLPVASPPGGAFAAMTDAQGPGSHVLYQDFVVPVGVTTAILSFDRYVSNGATDYFSPNTLDFTSVNNQQARVDLVSAGANPFSVAVGDVLFNAFRTQPGDPLVSGYTTVVADVSTLLQANAGQTLRLRFAEVDNQLFFNFGVDNVSLTVGTVPEPGSIAFMVGASLFGVGLVSRRRR